MPKYMFSDKEKENMVNDYLNGMPFNEMFIKYNIKGNKPIYRVLKENNIEINRNPHIIRYDEQMLSVFNERFCDAIHGEYVVLPHSDEYGTSFFNINYFNSINTPEKAYILGLLYADGNINQEINRVSISLQDIDKDILDEIKAVLEIEKPLRLIDYNSKNKNWHNQYCLAVSNKHFANALFNHGLIPKKSLVLKFPRNLPLYLYPHFFRGYMDGDGNISKSTRDRRVRFVSSESFCEDAKLFIETQLQINASIKDCKNNLLTKELCISGGIQAKTFLDWIYLEADMYIKRKYDIYQKYYQ